VRGRGDAKRLDKAPLPLEQVPRYGAQIADALDQARRSEVRRRGLTNKYYRVVTRPPDVIDRFFSFREVRNASRRAARSSRASRAATIAGGGSVC